MKILVISPCTKTQKHGKLPNELRITDFQSSDTNYLSQRKKELSKYKAPAAEMYKGDEHNLLIEGLNRIRGHNQYGTTTIDWHIISTGYGLINEYCEILPYNVPNEESAILKDGKKLKEDINSIINDFDLVFFLLGEKYVKALRLIQIPFNVSETVHQVFITYKWTKGYSALIPGNIANCNVVELKYSEFKNRYTAKGFVFKKLCEAAYSCGFEVFEEVKKDPQRIIKLALQDY